MENYCAGRILRYNAVEEDFMIKIGFPTLLFLIFLVLKLTKQIDWSWWCISLPLWGTAVIWLLIVLVLAIIAIRSE